MKIIITFLIIITVLLTSPVTAQNSFVSEFELNTIVREAKSMYHGCAQIQNQPDFLNEKPFECLNCKRKFDGSPVMRQHSAIIAKCLFAFKNSNSQCRNIAPSSAPIVRGIP